MSNKQWNICVPDSSGVCMFAAEEFARLISQMDPSAEAKVSASAYDPSADALWIGMDEAFPAFAKVEDPEIDDAIYIDVADGKGIITGINERSVLIAVYRFFRETGCFFLRPGREGEYIPQKDSMRLAVKVCETPAYRHRGICLEGSISFENTADMIDWAPKLGFNEYYIQLMRPVFAFRRWYEHLSNPTLTPTPVSNETIDAFVNDFRDQCARRGILQHRIGHGWASKLFGIISGAWHEPNDESEVDPNRRWIMAQYDGERKLFNGSGIDTNLCYSNPDVQDLIAEEVTDYARKNPQTKYIHYWFADKINNQCECEECKKERTADYYVEILNKIDEKMTAEGIDAKVVFLIYLDMLWAPVKNTIRNPDRFAMLFAPIRRSYSVPMASDTGHESMPYVRNGFVAQPEAGAALPYLRDWQKVFKGDSFIFDYHYMWDYINDPGCFETVRIMAKDIEDYRGLGLNGDMSCQNQRVFMPNGLGMNIMGNTMWNGKENFWKEAADYYQAAYGKDGEECMRLQEMLSDHFDPVVLRGEKPVRNPEVARKYADIPGLIDRFLPIIQRNLKETSGVHHRSWETFGFYVELCRKLSFVLYAASQGDYTAMEAKWADAKDFACRNEMRFQKEFDLFEFVLCWESKILFKLKEQAGIDFE